MMLNRDVEVIPRRWRDFSDDDDTWRGVPGQVFDWQGRFVDLDRPSMFWNRPGPSGVSAS